ncbi:WD repeat domain-containing protein 83 [Trametes pubescens]|uniref:WD repeat domain-containing protein 83 n=1 Tax=Trametes pubescens TaxID=154538 RepID=A0A1M2V4G7_TRAPU|nr:WD repeat domain-containing protein 83 [Trametes pubescens]
MPPSRGPVSTPRKLHQTLANNKGPVHVARYAKGTAKYVLSGGQDRIVRLWNPELGTEIKRYAAHGYEVLSITVAHDNSRFASSGGDRQVFVWDVMTGQTVRRIPGHMGKIFAVEFNEDASVLASGSYDSTVRLWDMKAQNRSPIQILEEARDSVQAIHIGRTYISTGSVDGHVRTYDLRMGELRTDFLGRTSPLLLLLLILPSHTLVYTDPVTAVVPSQDNQTYLVTTIDGHVRLMDMSTGKMLNDFSGHASSSYRIRACFGHGEASVVCGDEDGKVWAWDLVDAAPLQPNPPPVVHDKVITWVEHHPIEAGEMITASADGTVKVWRN